MRYRPFLLLVFALCCLPVPQAAATPRQNKGLLITPLRTYIKVDAGRRANGSITIDNLTEKTMSIALSVEQFSVANYTYDYRFKPLENDWITLSISQATLQPHKSQKISYKVQPPADTPPGGQYFSILATTIFNSGDISSRVQAASVAYVTVNGKLRETTQLQRARLPGFSFREYVNASFDVKNTGNVHFLVYTFGELRGLGTTRRSPQAAHILLPGTVRTVGADIPSPLLPGVYRLTFGYRNEAGDQVQRSKLLIYIPPWSLTLPIGVGWLWLVWFRRRKGQPTLPKNSN